MNDLLIIDALYQIDEYKNYHPLIELFSSNPELVVGNKSAHKRLVGLLSGEIKKTTGRRPQQIDEEQKWDYLIARVNAYKILGFHLYSTESDQKKNLDHESPTSAVGKVLQWNNEKTKGVHISYEALRGRVIKKKGDAITVNYNLINNIIDIYVEEKTSIDLVKVRKTEYGMLIDPYIWELFSEVD